MMSLRSFLKKLTNNYKVPFLEFLEEIKGCSDLTIKSYDETLNEASLYVEAFKERQRTILNLMPYRIKIAHLNSKTISKKLSAIHSFVKYLNDNGLNLILQADNSIKVPKTLPKPILHKQILKALEYALADEKLIIVMLYTLGLRISELSSLKIENISQGWIRVLGKGNKQRDIPLISPTKELIDEHLVKNPSKKFHILIL